MSSTTEDLTTRARIRDAAIHRFAAHGMDASLRAVAADAGVSAGLILHHFGSRAGLRAACDEHVFTQVREFKSASLDARTGPASMLAQIAEIDGFTDLIGYVLRVLQVGGAPTRAFIDSLVATNASYIDDAVRDGVVRPSRDPQARAHALTVMSLGALLLDLPAGDEPLDLERLPDLLRAYAERLTLPLLELYTEPVFTTPALLDAYLASRGTPDDAARDVATPTADPGPDASDLPDRSTA